MKHSEETKKKISESMKDYHASGLRKLKSTVRKLSSGVWKEINNGGNEKIRQKNGGTRPEDRKVP